MKTRIIGLALALCLLLAMPGRASAAVRNVLPPAQVGIMKLPEEGQLPLSGTYTITMTATGPGVAELYATSAPAGGRVYFLADPEPGYRVSFDKCGYYMEQQQMKLYYIGSNIYEIVMPDGDVKLDLEFVPIESASHPVRLSANSGGMVTVSQTEAKAGESVFLEIIVSPGAGLESVRASSAGSAVKVYSLGRVNGVELFEIFMPDGELEITVSFTPNGPYPVKAVVLSGTEEAGGHLVLSHQEACEGDVVTVTAVPDRGWELDAITTRHNSGLTWVAENVWSFVMPRYGEEVYASFRKTSYPVRVTVEAPVGGEAAADVETAVIGQVVTLTCRPHEGYRVARIGGVEELTDNGDGTCCFVMDAGAVEISVLFLRENNPFLDVNESHFYHDSVIWAVENGITTGVDEQRFDPIGVCNRAQVVTFLWRAAGCPESTGENPFTDVEADVWYTDAVLWAVENGITNGLTETTFGPGQICNRAQVVTFLWRAMGCPEAEAELPFADVESGSWYEMPVRWALEQGITNGMSDTVFGSGDECLRAQVVTFLWRAAQ